MSVPAAPTIASIVTEALKRGGRVTPSATDITNATEHQFREVKADIMLLCPTHPDLEITTTSSTTIGQQRYALPADCNIPVSLNLLTGPEDYAGTAQAGAATTITLASTFPAQDDEILGYYILITDGTGVDQYREIVDYVSSTKVATVDLAWTTNPDNTSVYLVVTRSKFLWQRDIHTDHDQYHLFNGRGEPFQASQFSNDFNLYPIPDRVYGLLFRYFVDLDQLDDADDVFLNLLRVWRSVWIQGVAVKTMQRYDEDRYPQELQVYQTMLNALSNQTCEIRQVQYRDLA